VGRKTVVPTVKGDVDAQALGFTLMHEHVFTLTTEVQMNRSEWDEEARIDDAIAKLQQAQERGICTFVDLTVIGLGRDVRRVRRVAEAVDLNIIVATGIYAFDILPGYFKFRGPGRLLGGEDPLVELFVNDIRHGIADTGIRAGILKCATDKPGVTEDVRRALIAVSEAQLATGVPISTHTDAESRRGIDQQQVFSEAGVDLTRVIIGHSGDTDDLDYLQTMLDRGSFLGMDRFGLNTRLPLDRRVRTVAELCKRGYAGQLVLSHDASCFNDHLHPMPDHVRSEHFAGWSFVHLVEDVIPMLLEAGVSQDQIDTMTVDNPRRIFVGMAK
jgi:phosphotriesterase-related protein